MPHAHNDSGSFLSLKRYDEYYLAGGDLFFLVEHNVFRVHRYFFERESSYFKGKLATPASPGATRQGTSETNAIVLEDVHVGEFARFLWVFYNPKYSLYSATVGDWTAILSLAHRWLFLEVKALAVRELEKLDMSDIDRVVTYHNNDVDRNLLIPRYAALCEREEPLSLAEGYRLGLETSLTIARAREVARRELPGLSSPTSPSFHSSKLTSIVRELFGIPVPEDDAVFETSPGGPPLPLTPPSTAPSSTPSPPPTQAQKTVSPQTVAPLQRPPTPPQETPSQPLPPPPPKPTERPQLQTGRQKGEQAKPNKQQQLSNDLSRPQTPVQETPVTESSNQGPKTAAQKRAAKRAAAAKKKEETAPTGSQTPRNDEAVASAGEVVPPQDGGLGGEKEKEEKEDANSEVAGEPSQESTEAGSSHVAPVIVQSANDEGGNEANEGKNIGATADGDSTDKTTTAIMIPSQNNDTKISPHGPSGLNNTLVGFLSPHDRQGDMVINNDDLKSPQEKSNPRSFFDEMLRKF